MTDKTGWIGAEEIQATGDIMSLIEIVNRAIHEIDKINNIFASLLKPDAT